MTYQSGRVITDFGLKLLMRVPTQCCKQQPSTKEVKSHFRQLAPFDDKALCTLYSVKVIDLLYTSTPHPIQLHTEP